MRAIRLRLTALLLCAFVLCPALSGCRSMLEDTPAFQYFNPVTLETSGDYPYILPTIKNISGEEEVNAALAQYFAPVMDLLAEADRDSTDIYISYMLVGADGSPDYTLTSRINGASGGFINLPDVTISDGQQPVFTPLPDLSYLRDGKTACAYMRLLGDGFNADTARFDEYVTVSQIYETMIAYYEQMRGEPVDISRFAKPDMYSELSMKALELGMTDYTDFDNSAAISYNLTSAASGLFEHIGRDVYGVSSQNVDLDRLMYVTDLFLNLFTPHDSSAESWTKIVDAVSSTDLDHIYYEEINRQCLSDAYVRAYENAFDREISINSDYTGYITDTDDENAFKAYSAMLIDTYPNYDILSMEADVYAYQLADYAYEFADECYLTWRSDNNIEGDAEVTYGDIIRALSRISIAFDDYEPQEHTIVDNSRDFDWYVSQFHTGKYSDVNCMPSISTMAIRWYKGMDSGASVLDLRELFLPESDSGWYMSQVLECMDQYDVPYKELYDINDTMLAELDTGHIILTQMSEAAYGESGHCFVIYGYDRVGDSVTFFIHDPGVYDGTDEYGKEPGRDMRIDSSYVYWIMNRIAFYYIAVGD